MFRANSPWPTSSRLHLALVASRPLSVSASASHVQLLGSSNLTLLHFYLRCCIAAVTAAGLAPTLSGPGPFTVFAPSDDAFAKLPAGTVDALLKDIPKLKAILTYHVVPGVVRPTRNGRTYDTVNGKEISVKVTVDTADSFMWGGQDTPAKVTHSHCQLSCIFC